MECKNCDEKIGNKNTSGLCRKCYAKKYLEDNKEELEPATKIRLEKWRKDNPEHMKEYGSKYYDENKDFCKGLSKKHYEENKEKRLEQTRLNQNKRYREDEGFRMRKNLGGALWKVIDCYIKTGKILNPCKKYGIDWEGIINVLSPIPKDRHKYHVDHILQLSKFDLTNIEQIQIAFAPENHRWLLAKDNLSRDRKGA